VPVNPMDYYAEDVNKGGHLSNLSSGKKEIKKGA
jgi:hypothetical protein